MRGCCQNILSITLVAVCTLPAAAAEVCVLSEAACHGPLVVLGDVAQVQADDAQRRQELESVELFPAPPEGTKRQLTQQELRELLVLRGMRLDDCRFYGASRTEIRSQAQEPGLLSTPSTGGNQQSAAEQRLARAIAQHLAATAGEQVDWQVEVSLNPQYVERFADSATQIDISGGQAPWYGTQSFRITLRAGRGAAEARGEEFTINARVKAVHNVVVAAGSLSRGQRLTDADIRLTAYEADDSQADVVREPEAVVGQEVTSNIAAGQPIHVADVRSPRLVLRNENVTMLVRREGVLVRCMAKALADGAQGDLIEVQTLNSRERFYATVTGPRQVELGGPPPAPAASPGP